MSKFHKKNKQKRKRRNIAKGRSIQELSNNIGEILLQSKNFEEDVETIETPFGEVRTHDGMLAHAFKSKGVLLDILTMNETVKEDDIIGRLVYFEKLNDKYPKEPYIAYEIAECYKELKELEKYDELIIENFKNYKGYPFIDISYVMLKFDNDKKNVIQEVFGKTLNLHDVYPEYKAFDTSMVADFYFVLGMIYKEKNELEIAKNCAKIVSEIDARKGLVLKTGIDFIEKPWLKWKTRIMMVLILAVIVGIFGGIIWGITKVFQMIF